MKIKVKDFVSVNTKYSSDNIILIVTFIKDNQLFGKIIEPNYALGNLTFGDITIFTKIINLEEILRLELIYKIYLIEQS